SGVSITPPANVSSGTVTSLAQGCKPVSWPLHHWMQLPQSQALQHHVANSTAQPLSHQPCARSCSSRLYLVRAREDRTPLLWLRYRVQERPRARLTAVSRSGLLCTHAQTKSLT